MCHVRVNKVTCRQGGTEREFACQDTGGNNLGQLAGVVTWVGLMGATNTEKVEHGALWFEDCTTTDSSDFDARHGYGNLKGAVKTREGNVSACFVMIEVRRLTSS